MRTAFLAVVSVVVALAVAVSYTLTASAASEDILIVPMRLSRTWLSGTITDKNATYQIDSTDIKNSSSNYTLYFDGYGNINFSYVTINLAGYSTSGGYTGLVDANFDIELGGENSVDLTRVVTGGEFYIGMWIPGYSSSGNYNIDETSFFGYGAGGTTFSSTYVGYNSVGAKVYKCTFSPSSTGNNSPLSQFTRMNVHMHWRGNPNEHEISLLFGNSSYLETVPSGTADLDYTVEKNEELRDTQEQIAQDLHVDVPDPQEQIDDINGSMASLDYEFEILKAPSSSIFIQWLTGAGVTTLSLCFLGYIFFGKKGG